MAAHGGHISVEKVEGGAVYLRMSGGCQGCAASAATLREGVERMLRAALPQIDKIVDVTDHAAGDNPFYARDDGPSPILNRRVPEGVIGWEDGQIIVDPDYLAPKLGITPEALRAGLQRGDVVGVTETGEGKDSGKTRIVLRTTTRAWAAEIDASGAAREIPPPRVIEAAAGREKELANRVRAHLQGLADDEVPITYGALARALGLWAPGSIAKVTRALETTMREDAAADHAFIAARAVNRGRDKCPGKGYFDLARALSRGPRAGEKRVGLSRPGAPSPEQDDGQINNFWRKFLGFRASNHSRCFALRMLRRLTAARGIRTGKDGKVPQTVSSPIPQKIAGAANGRNDGPHRSIRPLVEGRLWADCTVSVQIDAAEARRMDMRSDQEGSGRTRYGTRRGAPPTTPRWLARKYAPENGAIEDTDHQCRAQRDR